MNCKRIVIKNEKGGVGKTMTVFQLSGLMGAKEEKVLVLDFDAQANSSKYLLLENDNSNNLTILDYLEGRCTLDNAINKAHFKSHGNAKPTYHNVDVVRAHPLLKEKNVYETKNIDNFKSDLEKIINTKEYKWVLIDMPPTTKMLDELAYSIADYVLIPFSTDIFSLDGYSGVIKSVNQSKKYNKKLKVIGVFLSMFEKDTSLSIYLKQKMKEGLGDLFLDVQIPKRASLPESVMFSRPIYFYKKSDDQLNGCYEKLLKFIKERTE